MASELCLYRVRKQGRNDMKMQSVKVRLNTPPEMCGTVSDSRGILSEPQLAVMRWGSAWKRQKGVKQLPALDCQNDEKCLFDRW